MAMEEQPSGSPRAEGAGHRMSAAKQKRLEQQFEHASKLASQQDYDYSTELFAHCVAGDPANVTYLQSLFDSLKKKHGNNRKGSKLAKVEGAKARAAAKKSLQNKDWIATIQSGLNMLKHNPWDVPTLTAMAKASEELGADDCQLVYLRTALEANPRDPGVLRHCATVLTELGDYDQAINCWHRVQQVKPQDKEAVKAISQLLEEKARGVLGGGHIEAAGPSRQGRARAAGSQPHHELSEEEKLQQAIAQDPQETDNYVQLAQWYLQQQQFQKAETFWAKAFEVSDGDPEIRDHWEETQLRSLRQKFAETQKLAQQHGSEETQQELRKLQQEINGRELELFKGRCQRHPDNLAFKCELACRLQLAGQHDEAIKQFRLAQVDPLRRGICLLGMGQCFQNIKQYRPAAEHYTAAVEAISDRDAANKKMALYLAGKLAFALKDFDVAAKHLTALRGLDSAYRDAPALLDKIAALREDT